MVCRLMTGCHKILKYIDQGEKLVPNTFIMFVFLIYRIKSCSYSYPDLFSRTWWLLIIYQKISYQNRMENLIVWSLGHWTSVISYDVCYLTLFQFIVFLPNLYRGKRFMFCQIIHCKLSIMVSVGKKRHMYLHGI